MGSNGYAAEELVEALAYMAERKVDRASLISHRFPISQAPQAFAAQCAPEAIKVMLTMERN